MAFISLRDFLSIWHFKLIGLIGPRVVSERVNPSWPWAELLIVQILKPITQKRLKDKK